MTATSIDGPEASHVVSNLQAQARLPAASVEVWHHRLSGYQRRLLREDDAYRLDLCLNPRLADSRLCFADDWGPHRFEAPGTLFMLPPGKTLHVKSGAGYQHVIVCHLSVAHIRDWLDVDPIADRRRVEASVDVCSGSLRNLLLRLGEEALQPGFASDVIIEGMAIQAAVEVERYYRDFSLGAGPSGLAGWRLKAIEQRLQDCLDAPTLTELAGICGLSVRQLARAFKASRGVAIGSYVAQRRAEGAEALLVRGEPVKVVASKLGFSSSSSFGHAFRKATGRMPSEVRARSSRLRSA